MKQISLYILLLITSVLFSQQQKELLLDDFDGKSTLDWTEGITPDHYKSIKKGFYHVINRSSSKITWNSIKVPLDTSKNFSIETNVALYQNNQGEAILIYGENKEKLEFHFVRIRNVENAYPVQFGTFKNGEWKGDWRNASINPITKFNRITVKKQGDQMVFLINGIIIHTEKFKPFFGNTIGLGTGGPQHTVFDYLLVIQN